MLISLFNYSTGSHGRAVIKRKAGKMNGVKSFAASASREIACKRSKFCEDSIVDHLLPSEDATFQTHKQANKCITGRIGKVGCIAARQTELSFICRYAGDGIHILRREAPHRSINIPEKTLDRECERGEEVP